MHNLMRIGILIALVGLLQGCVSLGKESPETTYYLLTAEAEASAAHAGGGSDGRVSIGPVRIPAFLDRPQIVTRNGSQIRIAELHRWAEPLDTAVIRVVGENLERLYPQWKTVHHLAPQSSRAERSLRLEIRRLDGVPGRAMVDILWQLTDTSSAERPVTGHFQSTLTLGDDSHELLVRTLSDSLAQFCRELPLH